jgi:uncharacterized protein YjbJ (UPF0337 family)
MTRVHRWPERRPVRDREDDRKETTVTTKRPASKAKNEAQRARGKAKQAVGRTTKDTGMRTHGLVDETVADMREAARKAKNIVEEAGERAGEMAKDVKDRLKRAAQ